jgi:diguanylate cyclase (GGDEF)-like protein/PAS domain S-box-containing protein
VNFHRRFRLKNRARFALGIVLANIVVFAILTDTVAYSLGHSHAAYLARAHETSTNLAHTLSLSIGAEIKQIDNALQSVIQQLQQAEGAGPVSTAEVARVALVQQKLVPQADVIRVTDAQGRLINANETMSVADRAFFTAARLAPGQLVISEPIEGRILKKWGIALARARFDAHGRFLGIVYAKLSTDWLIDVFDDISVGPHGAVSLRSDTMRLIARFTPGAKDPYASLGTADVSPQLRDAIAASPAQGSFTSVTKVDRMQRVNAFERVQGYSPIVLVGVSTEDFFDPWFAEVRNEIFLAVLLELFVIGLSVRLFRQHEHQVRSRRDAQHLAEERQAMLDNQMVGMLKVKDRIEVWHNRALDTLFGYEPGELSGAATRVLYPDDESYDHVGEAYTALATEGQLRTQIRMVRKDGRVMWIDLSAAKLPDGESLWMTVDITPLKDSETQALHLASHDSLTGLLNRAALLERLGTRLLDVEASGRALAVCYIDLDGFKSVNDRHGHEAGDRVLKVAGQRLAAAVRAGNLVARLGGDEFVTVLCDLDGVHELSAVLARVLGELSAPIELRGGTQVQIGASIGVAIYPEHGRGADLLLRHADAALYQAKRSGKNRFVIFADEANPQAAKPEPSIGAELQPPVH